MKKIAFVSYEYPPDTGFGGIATYLFQIVHAFAERGMLVTVICSTPNETNVVDEKNGVTVYKIHCTRQKHFSLLASETLAVLHQQENFDLIEIPDYGADGLFIKKYVPDVPLVVKMHAPAFYIKRLERYYYYKNNWLKRVFKKRYNYRNDKEYKAVIQADHIFTPSLSLKNIISENWKIPLEKITHIPNPYVPNPELLNMVTDYRSKTILYLGRLAALKGVYNLAKAIPLILKEVPDARFLFVGQNAEDPFRKGDMKSFLISQLQEAASRVTFIDKVPLEKIGEYYQNATICVYPSLWENFPNVCLEAMSAAKIIVAGENGGMKEMLEDINGGILVDPLDEKAIAEACIKALKNTEQYAEMGERARKKITTYYAGILVTELFELYNKIIDSKEIRS